MQVSGPAFFSLEQYQPIIDKCKKIKESECYRASPTVKEKTDVIYNLFTVNVLQKVVLDDFLQSLTRTFNSLIEIKESISVFEFEEKGRLEFFKDELREPIFQFLCWFKEETARLSEMQKLIDFSKAMSLEFVVNKVKQILNKYPLNLGNIFTQIFDYEEIEENNVILKFRPLEDKSLQLVKKMEKLRKGNLSQEQCLKITALNQNLVTTHQELHKNYCAFMQKKQAENDSFVSFGKDFVGEHGYFKGKTYQTISFRWLRELLCCAVDSDWQKIAEHTGASPRAYRVNLSSLKRRNKFIHKHGPSIADYLKTLSNEAIDFADASGSESKDGTVGGNRALDSMFAEEGLKAMKRMETRQWPFFEKRELIEGLYYSYCLLIAVQSAENSRKKILNAIGESTSNASGESISNDDFFSPRPQDLALTKRFENPSAHLNEQLLVKPEIGGTLLNQTFSYVLALKQALKNLTVAQQNLHFRELAKEVRLANDHVLKTLEKNIRILQEKLDKQNFDL